MNSTSKCSHTFNNVNTKINYTFAVKAYVKFSSKVIWSGYKVSKPINRIDKYNHIFKSNCFFVKINDPSLNDVILAKKNNNIYISATIENTYIQLIFRHDLNDVNNPNGIWYVLIDTYKFYSRLPSNISEDFNTDYIDYHFSEFDDFCVSIVKNSKTLQAFALDILDELENSDDALCFTSKTVDIDGKILMCESATDTLGNTLNYYFDDDVLIKSETISSSNSTTSTVFSLVTTTFEDSLFLIPSDYRYINLGWLSNN